MKELAFVTGNPNKLADAKRLLPGWKINHVDFDVPEIQSLDLRQITEHKLRYAYDRVNEPCFVMDTSLSFECLNGFPGPFIKWYFEKTVGAAKTCQIAALFKQPGCQWSNDLAYFDGQRMHHFSETINGTVPDQPRGEDGYHWDVIFIPEGDTRTFAEMGFIEKHKIAPTSTLLGKLSDLVGVPA